MDMMQPKQINEFSVLMCFKIAAGANVEDQKFIWCDSSTLSINTPFTVFCVDYLAIGFLPIQFIW